jgi:hypothetical protein
MDDPFDNLEPPRGERDDEGRHVNPYVREEGPDGSVHDIEGGPTATERSDQSRLVLHTIEGLDEFLTPQGTFWLVYHLILKLFPEAIFHERGTPSQVLDEVDAYDPLGEFREYGRLHHEDLATIYNCLVRMSRVCPGCGRVHAPGEGHGDDDTGPFQPGVYVNKVSGESVKVIRVEGAHVYVKAEVAPERWIDRVYEKPWAEDNLVPADKVEVLTPEPDLESEGGGGLSA